ncbi:MAG TPA: transcription antitermination factor NusB [Methylosinus sp.]|jgi:16S rRNA (cytosine967-C5)-methyltransferase|uniref:RsmB/NOP family class I SAM-dependent RNA methyltransferase n=1 Tax=Methylosinus sp. TaxID=427 RepID=UPI002F93F45D
MSDHKPLSAKAKARAGFLPADAAREAEAAQVPGLSVRIAAANVIADVAQGGHRLDERFSPQAVPFRLAGMEPRDAALARSIAYVGVRRLGAIRHALAVLLEKGLPKQAARLEWPLVAAAAQILYLDVPDHAAVDLAVRTVRLEPKTAPFGGLVNGVLRNLIRRRDEFASGDPLTLDTPAWLAQRWIKTYGEAPARAIAAIHMQEPPLDLTVKSDAEGWARRLDGIVLPTGSVRLRSRTPIVELEGFADGEWWVQDAAAALPARLLAVEPDERVLDMCAAPGGKTAQLALARAQVTALDRSAERLKLLAANLQRAHLHADIAVGDAASYSTARPFDAILVDAPCAATGTIRRHPDVPWIKKPGDLDSLVALQSRILERASLLLRPEGRLVYCTCSLEPEEGEAQIASFLRRHPEMKRAPIDPTTEDIPAEFVTPDGDLRTLPSYWPNEDKRLAGLDGFFAARLVLRG